TTSFIPSDFPLAKLSSESLMKVVAKVEAQGRIEDIYPLTPMQQGILFHSLYEPEISPYFEQFSISIAGEINKEAFEQAWQQVAKRHEILRSSYVWEELDEPLQVVYKIAKIKIEEEDWRGLRESEQAARLKEYLKRDKAAGFKLNKAPLMRFALIRLAE